MKGIDSISPYRTDRHAGWLKRPMLMAKKTTANTGNTIAAWTAVVSDSQRLSTSDRIHTHVARGLATRRPPTLAVLGFQVRRNPVAGDLIDLMAAATDWWTLSTPIRSIN